MTIPNEVPEEWMDEDYSDRKDTEEGFEIQLHPNQIVIAKVDNDEKWGYWLVVEDSGEEEIDLETIEGKLSALQDIHEQIKAMIATCSEISRDLIAQHRDEFE